MARKLSISNGRNKRSLFKEEEKKDLLKKTTPAYREEETGFPNKILLTEILLYH